MLRIYPDDYLGHEDEWILFDAVETSEHLEITAPDAYVKVTIRHKAMRKADNRIFTAPVPVEPLAKSYAGPTALTELTIGKFDQTVAVVYVLIAQTYLKNAGHNKVFKRVTDKPFLAIVDDAECQLTGHRQVLRFLPEHRNSAVAGKRQAVFLGLDGKIYYTAEKNYLRILLVVC